MTLTDRLNGASGDVAAKTPCVIATIANITLSGTQTIDGVAVAAYDRVLVKDQTTASENGIYVVSSTSWSRAKDFDGARDAVKGTGIYVLAGSTQSAGIWRLATASATIGTTSLVFTKDDSTGDAAAAAAVTAHVALSDPHTQYLKKSSNLSDLASVSTARTNLGLGSAALLSSSGLLTSDNNLFDLVNASTARTNLGLGSMAIQAASSVTITGGTITGMPTPSSSSDVATKGYADSLAQGLAPKASCRVATTGALTVTYSNGTSGVGATLTNATTQAAIAIDSVTLALNDRVLVKNQGSTFQNGIYTVTTLGSVSTNWVLTRATDFDIAAEMLTGAWTIITAGTTNSSHQFFQASTTPSTVGTDAVTFTDLGAIFLAASNNLSDLTSVSTARSSLGLVIGTNVQAYDATLAALAAYNTNGVLCQTAADTFAGRTIAGTSNRISLTNGDGVSGAPTIDISASYVGQSSITTLGTVGTGVWNGTVVGATYGGTGINNGSNTITLAGNLVTSGANSLTFTTTGPTNVTIPVSGTLVNTSGNVATATALATARAIYGNNFDGSAALTQIIASTYGGTGNGFAKFSGAASSEKTYTLPNATCNVLTDNALVTVAQGGTGAGTLTGVLKGNGTSAFTAATAGSDYVAPGTATSFTAQQNFTAVAITSTSASIAWNLATAQSAKHTFTENTTLANPTNMVDGATYVLRLIQHASSPKTLAFGNAYRTPGGAGFTVSATNSAVDILTFVSDGTHMDMVGQKAFS